MRCFICILLLVFLILIPLIVWAAGTDATAPTSLEALLFGVGGLAASLVMGKIKKGLPFNWGFNAPPGKQNNNMIPVTNPIAVGMGAWAATNDIKVTAASVAGSFLAWGFHQAGKKLLQ